MAITGEEDVPPRPGDQLRAAVSLFFCCVTNAVSIQGLKTATLCGTGLLAGLGVGPCLTGAARMESLAQMQLAGAEAMAVLRIQPETGRVLFSLYSAGPSYSQSQPDSREGKWSPPADGKGSCL